MPSSTEPLRSATATPVRPSSLDRGKRWLVCGLVLAATLIAPPSHAEPEAFKDSYGAGKAALQQGAFQEALDHFRQSLRDAGDHGEASWKGMIGVAYAFRGLEQPGYALEYYRRFLDESAIHMKMLPPKWRARHEAVQAEVDELENQALETHALVSVTSNPEGARVVVSGLPAGADGTAVTPYPLYLVPGEHTMALSLDGHATVTRTIKVIAGQLVPVNIKLVPGPSEPAVDEPTTAPSVVDEPAPTPIVTVREPVPSVTEDAQTPLIAQTAQGTSTMGLGPIILLSAAGAVAMAAIGLTIGAEMKNRDLEEWERHYATLSTTDRQMLTGLLARSAEAEGLDLASSRDGLQLGSTICYTVGVGAAIGGLVWLMLGDDDADRTAAHEVPAIGFVPTDDGAMTSATWRF